MINYSEILAKYARREASAGEQESFRQWLQTLTPGQMEALIDEYGDIVAAIPEMQDKPDTGLLAAVHEEIAGKEEMISSPSVYRISFMRRWWAAASIILAVAIGAYLWNQKLKAKNENVKVAETDFLKKDIAPGKDGAILTLADGSQVVLDSLGNGVVAMQNGSQAVIRNGELVYDVTGNAAGEIVYNTMSTPKGRQFSLSLPDGTRVWLNAASSIRYPTIFKGSERRVEVKGEAYFEVAENKRMPFRADISGKAEIDVLGTHFNVKAYDNETSIHTTLLEGKVRVAVLMNGALKGASAIAKQKSDRPAIILEPGQQAQLGVGQNMKPGIKVVNDADIDKVMAWKNGLFNFQDASLEEVMRQLERWYDIEVVYENGVPEIKFWGEMSRDVKLSGVLKGLEESKVRFRMEGERKLVVLR